MDEKISKVIKKGIEERVFPGAVVAYIKDGQENVIPFGRVTYESRSPRVARDTIFDVASITKTIPTSSLLLWLIDNEVLSFDDKVSSFLPKFKGKNKDKVTLWHLLTYSVDLDIPAMSSLKEKTPDEIVNIIVTAPIKRPPGTKLENNETIIQTNAIACLMGLVIRAVTELELPDLADKFFFGPLEMKRSTFFPEKFDKSEIAPTAIDEWRGGLVHGVVHDESAYKLKEKYFLGNAGLFSTAPDLLIFMKMLLSKGEYAGKRFFSETIIEEMWTNQLGYIDQSMGFGWSVNDKNFMGEKVSKNAFGKTGFTGTVVVGDPEKNAALVILTNRINPEAGRDFSSINKIRREVCNIVFE